MFNHKFFLHEPGFLDFLEASRGKNEPSLRFLGFALLAHDLLGWFDAEPALSSVKLVCVATAETEKMPLSVRIRHHLVLHCTGGISRPSAMEDLDQYALARLPWQKLGHGVFELERSDPAVAQFINLGADYQPAYQALVMELAGRIDLAFQDVPVVHDLGLQSSSP